MSSYGLGGYPAGAEHSGFAPWNERECEAERMDREPITVDMTVYALVKVPVTAKTDDYEVDSNGYLEDINDKCGLAEANLGLPEGWELEEIEDVTVESCREMYWRRQFFDDWFEQL